MFEIRPIQAEEWEDFLSHQEFAIFVQSPTYGEFFKSMGEDYFIFGIFEHGKLIGGSLAVSNHARRGNFLYLPYGPVIDFTNETAIVAFFAWLKDFAKARHYDFVRSSPFAVDSLENRQLYKKAGLRPAAMHIIAENTWMLDVTKSEEELLSAMKKNHRNLIRRCEKEGVIVKLKTDEEALAKFNKLHDETVKRHKFHRYSTEYINQEFLAFNRHGQVALFEAYLPDGSHDATAFIVFYGNMAAYHHAASLGLNNKIPTSYLIQWEIIKEAKKRGMKWYNFWGIAPVDAPQTHPFQGVTHFKKGFGGSQRDLLHCHDLVVSPKYWLNWLVETVRRIKRGF